jgi:hypothetical protein
MRTPFFAFTGVVVRRFLEASPPPLALREFRGTGAAFAGGGQQDRCDDHVAPDRTDVYVRVFGKVDLVEVQ